MKITQEKPGFKPITITLETEDEVLMLRDIVNRHYTFYSGDIRQFAIAFLNTLDQLDF